MLNLRGEDLARTGGVLAPSRGTGSLISIAVHAAAAAFALYLYQVAPPLTPRAFTQLAPRLVSVVYFPENPPELPTLEMPAPTPPQKVETRTEEPLPRLVDVAPMKVVEPPKAELVSAPAPLPVEVAPPPPPLPEPAPSRSLTVGTFDTPVEPTPQPKAALVTPGGFDRTAVDDSRPARKDLVTASAGFDRASATIPTQSTRVVREAGFGDSGSPERTRPPEAGARVVTPSGFDETKTPQSTVKLAAPASRPSIVPVEVISKPTPAYTDEARQRKIEGEVVLNVEFASTGTVRVINVVRGLGHGLDEAAIRAAQQIQFRPARDAGRPVDFRTTVHIVFRLA